MYIYACISIYDMEVGIKLSRGLMGGEERKDVGTG